MIELNKKYRVKGDDWATVELWQGDAKYIYGRVGCYPISWFRSTGDVDQLPSGIQHLRDDLALVEVLPEVTVRRKVYDVFGECRIVGDATSVTGEGFSKSGVTFLGAIDITHNGKEITDVKVVKS